MLTPRHQGLLCIILLVGENKSRALDDGAVATLCPAIYGLHRPSRHDILHVSIYLISTIRNDWMKTSRHALSKPTNNASLDIAFRWLVAMIKKRKSFELIITQTTYTMLKQSSQGRTQEREDHYLFSFSLCFLYQQGNRCCQNTTYYCTT